MNNKEKPTNGEIPPSIVFYAQLVPNDLESTPFNRRTAEIICRDTTSQILTETTKIIINGVSKNTLYWTAERRQASLTLLEIILQQQRIPPEMMQDIRYTYIQKLNAVKQDAPPPDSLLEAERLLSPFFEASTPKNPRVEHLLETKKEKQEEQLPNASVPERLVDVFVWAQTPKDPMAGLKPKEVVAFKIAERRKKVIKLHDKFTQKEIAAQLGVHVDIINKDFRDMNLPSRRTIILEKRRKRVESLYKKGLSGKEIAKKINFHGLTPMVLT